MLSKCPPCCVPSHLEFGAPGARLSTEDWHFGAAPSGVTIIHKGLKIKACLFKTGYFYTTLRRPFRVFRKASQFTVEL